ncbi:MAG: hypothetical protein WCR06_06095, partial [bacterium]
DVPIREASTAPTVTAACVAKPTEVVDSLASSVATTNTEPRTVLAGVGGNPDGQNPEDRDENVSVLSTAEIVKRLTNTTDKIELRKAAQVLGDRAIAGALVLSADENEVVLKAAQRCMSAATAEDGRGYTEAKEQLERMWWPAGLAMLEHVADPNPQIAEMAIQGLSLMRNETIVRALIERIKSESRTKAKAMHIFALGCMTEQYESLVPRRTCMNAKESELLADKLIRPFLEHLEKTVTAPDVLLAIRQARADLKQAADHRPRDISLEKVDEKILRTFLAAMEKNGSNPSICDLYRKELARRSHTNVLESVSP